MESEMAVLAKPVANNADSWSEIERRHAPVGQWNIEIPVPSKTQIMSDFEKIATSTNESGSGEQDDS